MPKGLYITMKQTYLFLFYFLIGSFTAYSQYNISGKIVDASSEAQAFAYVVLFNSVDSQTIQAVSSDEDGKFQFSKIQQGAYYFEIVSLGYKPYRSNTLTVQNSSLELPNTVLETNDAVLGTVEVISTKPIIESKPDRLVFNVENSTTASSGLNGLELLRRTPGVSLDNEGEISIQGRADVAVFIDDKATMMTGDQLKSLLKSLQASDIASIEIINSPNSQFDATGTGGVVNIKLKKNKIQGWNNTAQATFMQGFTPKGDANLSFNYRGRKVSITTGVNGAYGNWKNTRNEYTSTSSQYFKGVAQDTTLKGSINGRLGLDYRLNDKHSVGLNWRGTFDLEDNYKWGNTNISRLNQSGLDSILQSFARTPFTFRMNYSSAYYKYSDTSGRKFNIDFDQTSSYNQQTNTNSNQYVSADQTRTYSSPSFENKTSIGLNIYALKADYAQQLGAKKQLGFKSGLKYSYTHIDNDFKSFLPTASGEISEILDSSKSNQFIYDEQIAAGYVQLSQKLKKFSYQAGLRAEWTGIASELKAYTSGQASVKSDSNYFNLFPNLNLGYQINKNHQLNLAFRASITRPQYSNLNPFVQRMDALYFRGGNAYLRAEKAYNTSLNYTLYGMFNIGVSYLYGVGSINRVLNPFSDGSGTPNQFLNQPQNIGVKRSYMLNVSAPFRFTKWLEGFVNVYAGHLSLRSAEGVLPVLNTSSPTYGGTGQITAYLDKQKTWTVEFSGWYKGAGLWNNWVNSPMGVLNSGISKKMLDGALVVRLNLDDLLYTARYIGKTNYNGLISEATGRWEGRMIKLNVSYAFGTNKNSNPPKEEPTEKIDNSRLQKDGGGGR